MKVLYISTTFYFDMDLSLLQSLSKKVELYYLLDLPTFARKCNALEINTEHDHADILGAEKYPELENYKDFIDLEKTYVINRTSKKGYALSNLNLQRKIVQFAKEVSPDLVHCNGFLNFNFFSFLFKNRFPIIQTIHDPFPHSGENNKWDKLERKLNSYYIKKKILLNQNQKGAYIKENKLHEEDIFISSLGVYSHLSKFKKEKSLTKPSSNVLFFGRISLYKGVDYLIEAVKLLVPDIPNIKLTVAGKGDFWFDITDIQSSASFRIINKHISNNELVDLINETDLIVCPYVDATQSGVIMTAFAFCKPVVATNVGGIPEMIEDGETGILVDPKSIDQLAVAIKDLLLDAGKLKKMEENIESVHFRGKGSWDNKATGLVKIYQSILAS